MNDGYTVKHRKYSDENKRSSALKSVPLRFRLYRPSRVTWGVTLLILFNIFAGVLLYRQNQAVFLKLQATLMDPTDQYFEFSEPPVDFTARHVIFYGDSRARMWPDVPGMQGIQFWNRGIGGHSSLQVLLRWEHHMRPLLNRLPTNPKPIVVLQVGVNDLKNVHLFPNKHVLERTQQHLRDLVALAARDCVVVLTTIFPTGQCPLFTFHRLVWQHRPVAQAIAVTNDMLRGLRDRVNLLDAARLLVASDTTFVDGQYQKDLLHLNSQGYALLNWHLEALLKDLTLAEY